MVTFLLSTHTAFPQQVQGVGVGEVGSEFSGVSSYRDSSPIRSEPTLMTSFNLNYFLGDPISKYRLTRGLGLLHMNFVGTQTPSVIHLFSCPKSTLKSYLPQA